MTYVKYCTAGGQAQLVEIPEERDTFEVLEAARQRMFPGVAPDPNWKHPNARYIAPASSHERKPRG